MPKWKWLVSSDPWLNLNFVVSAATRKKCAPSEWRAQQEKVHGKMSCGPGACAFRQIFAPTGFTYIEYIGVLPAMNRRVRLWTLG